MYQQGDRVEVEGLGGRRAVLRVWQDHGHGLTLSSEAGYVRALAGDPDAPLVGFPKRDVRGRADTASASTSEPQPLSARSPTVAQA